jgi:hypothetical protein
MGPGIVSAKPQAQNLQCLFDLAILGGLGFSKVKPAARLRPDRGPGEALGFRAGYVFISLSAYHRCKGAIRVV